MPYLSSPSNTPSICLYIRHTGKRLNLAFPLNSLGIAKRLIAHIAGGGIKVDAIEEYGLSWAKTNTGFLIRCHGATIKGILQYKPSQADLSYRVPKDWSYIKTYDPALHKEIEHSPRELRRLRRLDRSARKRSLNPVADSSPKFNVAEICKSLGINPKVGRRHLRSLDRSGLTSRESIVEALRGLIK